MSTAARRGLRSAAAVATASVIGALLSLSGPSPAVAADVVVWGDADLQAAVNAQLSWERGPYDPVTFAEAATVTDLTADDDGIDSLIGIERLTNLVTLSVSANRISDLSPLSGLTKLRDLWAGDNRIVNASPLATLPSLENASLWAQEVTLPTLATTARQANPLRALDGDVIVPESATALVSASGGSWRLTTAGSHTLTWWASASLRNGGYFSFDGTITQAASGPSQLSRTPTPTMSGVPRVGSTLTAVPGTWDAGVGFTYQWLADGAPIAGATGKKFTLGSAQHRRTISVAVTGSKTGFSSVTKTSAATLRVIVAPVPIVKGTPKLGAKLTASPGAWTSGTALTLQWYADKVAIPGERGTSFTVTSTQSGKKIFVRVAGVKSGYAKVAVSSSSTSRVTLLSTSSRSSVAVAYKRILAPALKVTTGWTGSTSGCRLGAESAASRLATLNAVNVVRAMNQLDGVRLASAWNTPALRNSLMMQARNQITHYPTRSGACWSSSGASAAARSNLYLGTGFSRSLNYATGARAIVGYMDDPGPSNIVAGHRRWIMEPGITVMGTGSTSQANTLTVMGTNGPVTSKYNAAPAWMEWPSAGWFPRQLDPEGLWSLSSSDPGADFRAAKVTVRNGSGTRLSVTKYSVADGYGPNTMTWKVTGVTLPRGTSARSYVVTVTGIRGAASSSYTYTVKMFDPLG